MPHHDDPDHWSSRGASRHLADRPVLVVDFGAQYAQLIARRVREASVYSEIVPHTMPVAEMLAKNPAAIILSGGPSSVYADGAPALDPALFEPGVPVFGICYGFQAMAQALGGKVAHTGLREYGGTPVDVLDDGVTLLDGQPAEQKVWMSHGDSVSRAPDGLRRSPPRRPARRSPAFEDDERRLYGVQWHPEVMHSTFGQQVLENFLHRGRRADRGTGPAATSSTSRSPGSAPRSATAARHLRAVRRRRLRGRRGARAEGRRRPAHLRLRRPRAAAQGRGRAGRAGLRRRDRRRPRRRRRARAVPRRARRGHRPRGEAQDHRPRVHPRLRAGRARSRRLDAGDGDRPGRVPRAGHALPRRRRVRRRHRHREHQVATTTSAACPTTCSSSSSSRCAPCSRTRCARSAASSACPR